MISAKYDFLSKISSGSSSIEWISAEILAKNVSRLPRNLGMSQSKLRAVYHAADTRRNSAGGMVYRGWVNL